MTLEVVKGGRTLKLCRRCIYDETVSGISFDEEGVCNYCRMMEGFKEKYKTGTPEGEAELQRILEQVKEDGKGKKYDCIVGVSGGTDSSYLLVKLKEWGLRPLAVHLDNTWNTAIATENIKVLLDALDIDLYTHVVDNREMDDIYKSFLKAGVPELDAAVDIGILELLDRTAAKFNIRYIFEGHSYATEGISPLNDAYFDGKYIKDIHNKFGTVPMKTYPLLTFWHFMKWIFVKRIKRIRPFWYINYCKEDAQKYLEEHYGWKNYGGHHLENRISQFRYSWYDYKKFGLDIRNVSLAAAVRSGFKDREEAIQEYFYQEPYLEEHVLDYVKERLNYTDEDLENILKSEKKRYTDYKTYKKYFRMLKPVFYLCMKANLVAESFYVKYTSKD